MFGATDRLSLVLFLSVSQLIAAGKWVKLEKTTYVDPAGNTRYCSVFSWHGLSSDNHLSTYWRSDFSPTRTWETAKRTTRQTNTQADGERLRAFCFPVGSSVGPCTDTKVRLWAKPAVTHFSWQVSESSRCWNGHSTKTALWWWSSFVPLWDATLWSFLQVNSIFFFFLKWIPQTSLQLFIVSPEFHQKKPSSLNFLCGKVLISSLKTILHFIPLLT